MKKGLDYNYSPDSFGQYLQKTESELFTLDLSNCSVLEVIEELIKMRSSISPRCYKSYSCLKNSLKSIEQKFGCRIMPYQITDVFWNNFVPFLIDRGLALSSIKTVCAQLRSVLNWASRHQAKLSSTFDLIKLPSYCHQQIALTADDVSHIYHFNIDSIPRRKQFRKTMERVRDMFVLSCNLGQRYSDMVRIDPTCFDRNIFTIMQQKTGIVAKVDIERFSLDRTTTYKILEKYNYYSPVKDDITNYNKYLKELLQYIGFDEQIKRETRVNGVVESKFCKRWSLISSHTARRTFATLNLLRGHRTADIRRATGHKTESSFEKYICYFDD